MKMSRRKLFGVSLGGAIAGPSLAREAMNAANSLPSSMPTSVPYWGGKDVADKQYTYDMLAKLKRLARGDIRDEDRNYPTEGPPSPFGALRSISDEARSFLRTRRYEQQWRERTIKSALDALDHYDKTGILRTLF